ncbi:MAG: hypothetical protein AUF79_16915 [Crenarchaeota archaeon 13_1_20CM_2_51_8]|nr:MAG: hypothetical protein AUF79_16915 [Crenarchaeota archaeon 13_1_20CM_2_51_8]
MATVKSLAGNGPSHLATGARGRVEVRPFPAEMGLRVSEAQGLSGEAMKWNPTTAVIPRVDESKSSPRTIKDLTEPKRLKY